MNYVITKKALREFLREAMFNEHSWSQNNIEVQPIPVNSVVDPSSPLTDPEHEQTPTNRQELKISINAMIDSTPEEELSNVYDSFKSSIEKSEENEEKMKVNDVKAEQILRSKIRKAISESIEIENLIRKSIRQIYVEAAGAYRDTGLSYSGDMTSAPSGYEWCDNCEGNGEIDGNNCAACRGSGKIKKDKKYITSKDTGFGSVADMVAAGIPQGNISGLMKSAMGKFKSRWPKEQSGELDVALLSAVPEYIEYLKKQARSGGDPLTAADVQLMNDHPEIVLQSDRFREFFNRTHKDY